MFKLTLSLLAATLLYSTSAQAAFVKTDWKASGDQRALLHEETGIEWLRLPETSRMSINQVLSQLDTTFAGWRLPTKEEVNIMLSSALGIKYTENYAYLTAFNPRVAQHSDNIGISFANTPGQPGAIHSWRYTLSYAMYLDELGRVNFSGVYDVTWNNTTHTYLNSVIGTNLNHTSYAYSVYLVNDGGVTLSSILNPSLNINNPNAPVNVPIAPPAADVSLPLSLSALGFGLFALMRRKI